MQEDSTRKTSPTLDSQDDVTKRYDRMASLYDLYDAPMEWMGTGRRRRELVKQAEGIVLEVGVGTGKNLRHYPKGTQVTGVDVSNRMLARAKKRAVALPLDATLLSGDVTQLDFPDASFDTTLATCVFCSVADPVAGLSEMARVTKPGGRILLLEHVRPRNPILGRLSDAITVVTRRIFGFRANRRTEDNLAAAGVEVTDISRHGIWRTIVARSPRSEDAAGDAA